MFERRHQPLLSHKSFLRRFAKYICLGLGMIAIALGMGMMGYHFYENLPWLDAYLNAAMILSGMGPVNNPISWQGKLFAGSYALFSGLFFLIIFAVILAPVIHRAFHKFHIEEERKK